MEACGDIMNYRIDHLAFRTFDREKAVKFLKEALGYKEQAEFTIYFDELKTETAMCTALEPSDRTSNTLPWFQMIPCGVIDQKYVLSPEIFVSEGTVGSVVHNWCVKHGPGLHHIALQCPENSTIEKEMEKWIKFGWTESFSSEVIKCDNLSQVFTKPSVLFGVVFELIQRKESGFCRESVKNLMNSTVDVDLRHV
jgi:4-hydroxyphenylpyruvate dioxygenase-like putative hemolysin